ncbi:MAG: RDD family protein [Phycisphaerales bacterium]
MTQAPPQPLNAKWVREGSLQLPSAVKDATIRTIGPAAPFWLVREGGQTLLAERTLAGMMVWRLDSHEAEPTVLWTSGELPADVGVLTVGGLDACTVLAFTPEHGGSGSERSARGSVGRAVPDAGHLRVVDISASTGAVLADVAAHTDGFLSRRELWILWLLFIGVGVVVLLVVVNADGPQEVQLPEGYALATPGRRALAGVLDLAAAIGVTSLVVGGTPAQWLSPATSTSSSLIPLVGVVVFAFVLSTIGEALAGASPGKLLVGARVMGLEPVAVAVEGKAGVGAKKERGQPTLMRAIPVRFMQAVIRNAIRWFMPPMGLAMIADDNWRHPGDQLGKTVVVVKYEVEEEVGGGEEE